MIRQLRVLQYMCWAVEPEHERRATGVGGSEEEKVEGGGRKKKILF